MRKALLLALVAVMFLASAAAAGVPGRFMQYPTISGDTIVFTYDGAQSLYAMPATGGAPKRVTYFGAGVQAVACAELLHRLIAHPLLERRVEELAAGTPSRSCAN